MLRRVHLPVVLLLCFFLYGSCKKKFLDVHAVLTVLEDRSIKGAPDIKYFAFPADRFGYAGGDTSFIYRTADGGRHWEPVIVDEFNTDLCRGLEFFTAFSGMCLMGKKLYVTHDGGDTWNRVDNYVAFIGMTADKRAIMAKEGPYYCEVNVSDDEGDHFNTVDTIRTQEGGWSGKVAGTSAFVIMNHGNYGVKGVDIESGEQLTLVNDVSGRRVINDVNYWEGRGIFVGSQGMIQQTGDYDFIGSAFRQHQYTFYSVDVNKGLILAVGEKTVTTNLDIGDGEYWTQVLSGTTKDSFEQTFYKVQFRTQHSFFISGSKGLLWKATL